jgi:carboxylesterase type B
MAPPVLTDHRIEAPMESVIKTRQGDVRGRSVDGVHTFKGIPYAAPPVGANRLRPPRPVAPWSGIRDALAFGPKTLQPAYPPGIALLLQELTVGGDDCLTLNVWSPGDARAGHPVMVWIPGGMFEFHATGASPWYDGSRFARDGIVCVSINYRVGADGFLYTGDEYANIGLLDQIAALTWVRDNIVAFGGDPGNVTVFGESAGAMSIAALLSMPRAEGLFRRAILQSGAAHPLMSAATARRVCGMLASKLGVAATREAIASVPVDRLLRAQTELHDALDAAPDPRRWGEEVAVSRMLWQPVIDGDVIPAHPLDRISAGAGAAIDVLVGTNTDEHRLFLASTGAIEHITEEMLAGAIAAYGLPVDRTLAIYRERHAHGRAGDLLAAVQTDWYWRGPAVRLAEAHARHSQTTYMYEFGWRSPQFNGLLGACHALEVPFVFDTLGHGTEPLWGPNPPQPLADTMHAT